MAAEWRADHAEEPAVRTWRVLGLVGGFLAFVAVLFGILTTYYRTVLMSRNITMTVEQFPAPQLQPNPNQDYLNFHAAQVEELVPGNTTTSAGMPSTDAMPIDKAMALVVARGAQAYDPPAGTPPAGPSLATGAPIDGAPRATPSPGVAPYGQDK